MSWIKLHRDIVESKCFAHPTTLKIWLWMLTKANHKDSVACLQIGRGFTEVEVKRGQFIFGRNKAESVLEIDGSTIYKHIQKLEEWGNIIIESNNQYSIVTICKYDDYQTQDGEEEQPSNSRVTAEEQQSNSRVTHKRNTNNVKNVKNVKKEVSLIFPFNSDQFKKVWDVLAKEKKWRGKSESALQASLKKLSKYDEPTAIKMIEDCIAGEWQGFVEPKQNNNGNTKDKFARLNAFQATTRGVDNEN